MKKGFRIILAAIAFALLPVLISASSLPTWESFLLQGNRSSIRGRSRTLYICPVSGLAGRLRTIGKHAEAIYLSVRSTRREREGTGTTWGLHGYKVKVSLYTT